MPRKTDLKRAKWAFLPGESSACYQARGLLSVHMEGQLRTMGKVLVLEAVPSAGRVRPPEAGGGWGGGEEWGGDPSVSWGSGLHAPAGKPGR